MPRVRRGGGPARSRGTARVVCVGERPDCGKADVECVSAAGTTVDRKGRAGVAGVPEGVRATAGSGRNPAGGLTW
jgi:hypothetical protein